MGEKSTPEEPQQSNPKKKGPKWEKSLSAIGKFFYFLLLVFFLVAGAYPLVKFFIFGLPNLISAGDSTSLIAIGFLLIPIWLWGRTVWLLIYRLLVPIHKQKPIGQKLWGYVVVNLGFWFMVAISLPAFNQYKARAYNNDSKSNLHNLYLGCKEFWISEGSDKECNIRMISQAKYGFIQSSRVNLQGHGTETTFTAKAQHLDSTTRYTMDSNGNIK